MADSRTGCLPIVIWTLAIVVVSAVALYSWRVVPSHTYIAPAGTPIRYDDFSFAVTAAERVPAIGDGEHAAKAFGKFVIVHLAVINEAKRVDFTFRPEIARLVNRDGREFGVSPAGQAALAALGREGCTGPVAAGTRCEAELAFEVPANEHELQLRLIFGGGILDLLDTLAYGNRRLMLP